MKGIISNIFSRAGSGGGGGAGAGAEAKGSGSGAEGARGLEDEAEVIEGDLHGSRHALVAVNGHGTRQTRALRSFRARGNIWTAG